MSFGCAYILSFIILIRDQGVVQIYLFGRHVVNVNIPHQFVILDWKSTACTPESKRYEEIQPIKVSNKSSVRKSGSPFFTGGMEEARLNQVISQ